MSRVEAQDSPRVALHLFGDQFMGIQGPVVYPQYAWNIGLPIASVGGYGYLEAAPHQPFFTNNLVVFTPNAATWFSVHTETGGMPNEGLKFFQIGPRINMTCAIPKVKRPMEHLFVAVLPRFEGVRPNNILLAGATNRFKITGFLLGSVEGYRRFYPRGAYFGEYWALVHPKKTPHLSWGMFILNDSTKSVSLGFGGRVSLF
jgi:hypothetical protein